MNEEEFNQEVARVEQMTGSGDYVGILGHLAISLMRVANAQERLVSLAEADLQAEVEAAVESRSREVAEEMVADQNKRSFIGKR